MIVLEQFEYMLLMVSTVFLRIIFFSSYQKSKSKLDGINLHSNKLQNFFILYVIFLEYEKGKKI